MSKVVQQTFQKKFGSRANATTDPQKKNSNKATTNKPNDEPVAGNEATAIVYIGHLPENFEEPQVTDFLSQFGTVVECRVSRSPKTGRPRGYGFVRFADVGVARIVADTMSGYLVANRRIVCHVMPKDKIHPKLFRGAGKRFKVHDRQKIISKRIKAKLSTEEGVRKMSQDMVRKDEKKRRKLAAMGIEYEYPQLTLATTVSKDDAEARIDPDTEDEATKSKLESKESKKDAKEVVESLPDGESKEKLSAPPEKKKGKRVLETKTTSDGDGETTPSLSKTSKSKRTSRKKSKKKHE